MSRPEMLTGAYWIAVGERAVRMGAGSVLTVWAVGDGVMNATQVDWADAGGYFLGGAVFSVLFSLAGGTMGRGAGPSFLGRERLARDNMKG